MDGAQSGKHVSFANKISFFEKMRASAFGHSSNKVYFFTTDLNTR